MKISKELEKIFDRYVDKKDFVLRIGGDQWRLFFQNHHLEKLKSIFKAYSSKTMKVKVGWEVKATSQEKLVKEHQETKISTLQRGLKICYAHVADFLEFKEKSKILLFIVNYHHYYFPVNELVEISTVFPEIKKNTWRSIDLILPNQYCPFCYNEEFNWKSINRTIFSGYANCSKCAAELSFFNIAQVERELK